MALSATTLVVHANTSQSVALDLATATVPLNYHKSIALVDGVGAGQADMVWHDTRTLAASATEDLDLAGVLTDPFGNTLTFARIKALVIVAAAANTNNVLVGGAASNGFVTWVGDATDIVKLRPGAAFALFTGVADATGYAVTAATGDKLTIANSGAITGVTYDIVVIGASA